MPQSENNQSNTQQSVTTTVYSNVPGANVSVMHNGENVAPNMMSDAEMANMMHDIMSSAGISDAMPTGMNGMPGMSGMSNDMSAMSAMSNGASGEPGAPGMPGMPGMGMPGMPGMPGGSQYVTQQTYQCIPGQDGTYNVQHYTYNNSNMPQNQPGAPDKGSYKTILAVAAAVLAVTLAWMGLNALVRVAGESQAAKHVPETTNTMLQNTQDQYGQFSLTPSNSYRR